MVKSYNVKSINYGTHTASFAGPRIWDTTTRDFQTYIHQDLPKKNPNGSLKSTLVEFTKYMLKTLVSVTVLRLFFIGKKNDFMY